VNNSANNSYELKDNKETLDKYKEKLIDYEFSYDPSPSESLEILQDKLTAFKEYPLDTGSILLFAYSISLRKEEVCALMAAISIILSTISVVTSGVSLI
jgi:hypothetical protein